MSVEYTDVELLRGIKVDNSAPLHNYASGDGPKIPTRYRVQYGDNRWRRVYVAIYGNAGSAYIVVGGKNLFLDSETEYKIQSRKA